MIHVAMIGAWTWINWSGRRAMMPPPCRHRSTTLDDTFKKIEHLIESAVNSAPSEKKFEFLDKMNTRLERLILSNLRRMKMAHKSASYPSWLFNQSIGKTNDGTKITRTVRPDISSPSYLDHFGRLIT